MIGTFLFDDIEVPLLISLTTGAESIFVMDADGDGKPRIALLLPSFAHLLYGDLLPCLLQKVWVLCSWAYTGCIFHFLPAD